MRSLSSQTELFQWSYIVYLMEVLVVVAQSHLLTPESLASTPRPAHYLPRVLLADVPQPLFLFPISVRLLVFLTSLELGLGLLPSLALQRLHLLLRLQRLEPLSLRLPLLQLLDPVLHSRDQCGELLRSRSELVHLRLVEKAAHHVVRQVVDECLVDSRVRDMVVRLVDGDHLVGVDDFVGDVAKDMAFDVWLGWLDAHQADGFFDADCLEKLQVVDA